MAAAVRKFKFQEHDTPNVRTLRANEGMILRLYSEGTSISKLSQMFSVHLNTVICFLKRRDVRLRTKSEAMLICWTDEDRARMSRQRKGRQTTLGLRWKYDRFIAKPGIRGPLNGMWRGGTKVLQEKIRGTKFYREWRTAVFVRDDYTCRLCKARGGKIQADHVVPFSTLLRWYSITSVEEAANCLAFSDTDNGRTLCLPCHKNTPTYAGKMNGGIRRTKS